MRKVVNTEVLDLIYTEVANLRSQDLSDQHRNWLVSVYNATKDDLAAFAETGLENLSDAQLMELLDGNTHVNREGVLEKGISGISHETPPTGTAQHH